MRARPPGTVAPRRGRVCGLCCKLCGGGTALLAWVLLGLLCGGAVLFANPRLAPLAVIILVAYKFTKKPL